MRIGLLSATPRAYSTRRLKQAAKARGHKVKLIDYLKFALYVEENTARLFINGKSQSKLDAVIPRIGTSATFFGTAVVRQFEQLGVFALNGSHAISVARDKLRTLQVLSRHRLGIPASIFVQHKDHILPAIDQVGGAPVMIKLLEGTQGIGVILAESNRSAEAIVETLHVAKQNVLIQKFVAESRGKDIRAFVVGGRVVAAMRRVAQGDEFRSNVHRGGLTEAVKLNAEYESTAIRAAQIIGLNVAGVDLLESIQGPLITEVNASPGLEGIEEATGIDVADAIISYLEEQVPFPYFDIGERLSLTSGFTLVEIEVTRSSPLARKTLAELKLAENGVQILCILRQGLPIPNPTPAEKILSGDTLLCFGEKLALKELLPEKVKRLLKNDGKKRK